MSRSNKHREIAPVIFVKAKDTAEDNKPRDNSQSYRPAVDEAALGKDVKSFYEGLTQPTCSTSVEPQHHGDRDSLTNKTKGKKRSRTFKVVHSTDDSPETKKSHKPVFTERDHQNFLRLAQEGDVKALNVYVDEGLDVDVMDQYGWTALMCACCSTQIQAVKLLLDKGADISLVNKQGQSAKDIAQGQSVKDKSQGHDIKYDKSQDIIDLLDGNTIQTQVSNTKEMESFYCDLCKTNIFDKSKKAHSTSTLHLFNLKLPIKDTSYFLNESNKGFQMMVQSGWNKERGLGNVGQGKKYPVKTLLKRDRLGLGSKVKDKAKVTHFSANDTDAVKKVKDGRQMRVTTLNKRRQSKLQAKQKAKEKAFRREFYTS